MRVEYLGVVRLGRLREVGLDVDRRDGSKGEEIDGNACSSDAAPETHRHADGRQTEPKFDRIVQRPRWRVEIRQVRRGRRQPDDLIDRGVSGPEPVVARRSKRRGFLGRGSASVMVQFGPPDER